MGSRRHRGGSWLCCVAGCLIWGFPAEAALLDADGPEEVKIHAAAGTPHAEFGNSVALEGRWAVVGAQDDDYGLDPSGSAHVFRRDHGGSWSEVAELASGLDEDAFGFAVALSGPTVVVGAWGDDSTAFNAGAVYVFRRDAGGAGRFGQVAKLVAGDAAQGDRFGTSVAIDGNRIVVGAELGDTADANTGAAYVFEKTATPGDAWHQVAKLAPTGPQRGARFGASSAVVGTTALVGAPWTDLSEFSEGAAHVFERDPHGAWLEVARLTASDAEAADFLGASVSLTQGLALVGANGDDEAGSFSGAAYVFARAQEGAPDWAQTAKLIPPDTDANQNFGWSVSAHGSMLAVGARGDGHAGPQSGAAYLFRRDADPAGRIREVVKLRASDAAGFDGFGRSVGVHNGKVLVGSPGSDVVPFDSGAAYVFATRLPRCSVDSRVRRDGTGLALRIGAWRPSNWALWSFGSGSSELLGAIPIGVIDPPIRVPFALPGVPPAGTVGFGSTLSTDEGDLVCAGFDVVVGGTDVGAEVQFGVASEWARRGHTVALALQLE